MKVIKIAVIAALTVLGFSMCSQNKQADVLEEAVDSCAVVPEFPGGANALLTYLKENIHYPKQAEEVGLEGRVIVKFVIEKDGSIGDVEITESADSLLDAEAARVINAMPAWTPGQNEAGEAVRVKYTIPITFTLEGTRDKISEAPMFAGGMEAYVKFMSENIKYPKECVEKGIQGRVLVDIIIDQKGNVTEPKVKKSVDPLLDAEALRVVKAMPKWTPGMKDGAPVSVSYTVPVTFTLN